MNWVHDPEEETDTSDGTAQVCKSGSVTIGSVLKSGSGRWRWEIVMLPGLSGYRNDLRGWKETEPEAKAAVEDMFSAWCEKAGLSADAEAKD
ncbi:hypothetical protein Cp1R7AA1_048 [Mesorhizobium phage Cp1R7A-A1]|nr:hypothetical protein Cp1R7AA1_048 [Mesorhizobium phage Cp1R7A-A1]